MAEIRILPPAARYLKKIKDNHLKTQFQETIKMIQEIPTAGRVKTGDLAGIYCIDFHYDKTTYEVAYAIHEVSNIVIVVILAGNRENFYTQLKKYI
jgi:mRNA interferase RelE/StbE